MANSNRKGYIVKAKEKVASSIKMQADEKLDESVIYVDGKFVLLIC